MKYIFRIVPRAWNGDTLYYALEIGEQQYIRANRKQSFMARCFATNSGIKNLGEKVQWPRRTYSVTDKFYYSREALMAAHFVELL